MKLLSEIIGPRAERTLQKLSDIDQGIKRNAAGEVIDQKFPTKEDRDRLQRRFAKVMSNPENRAAVIDPKKMGKQGRDAVFTLTQHSDRHIGMQKAVHADMKRLDPENPRNYYLGDRIGTNQAGRKIVVQQKLADRKAARLNPDAPREPSRYSSYGKTSREAVGNMRIPNRPEFDDPKQRPTTAKAGYDIEKKYGNELLTKSVDKADKERGIVDRLSRKFSQPSHASNPDNYSLNKFGNAVKSVEKAAPTVSKIASTVGRVAGPIAGAAGAADTAKDIAFSTKTTRDVGHELYKNPVMKTVSDTMLSAREKLGIPSTAPEEFQRKSQPKTP